MGGPPPSLMYVKWCSYRSSIFCRTVLASPQRHGKQEEVVNFSSSEVPSPNSHATLSPLPPPSPPQPSPHPRPHPHPQEKRPHDKEGKKSEEQGFAKSAEFFIQARKKRTVLPISKQLFSEDFSFPFRLLLLFLLLLQRDP